MSVSQDAVMPLFRVAAGENQSWIGGCSIKLRRADFSLSRSDLKQVIA